MRWRVLILGAFALYLAKGVDRIARFGEKTLGHAAGDIESVVREAAKIFAEKGFLATWGLPVYPGYPILSDIPKLRENFVYAHQFPGPEYVLALFYKVFGVNDAVFQWGRLFPLLTSALAVFLFARAASRRLFDGSRACEAVLVCLLLSLPSLGHWALQWAGMSYATSLLLATFAAALWFLPRGARLGARGLSLLGFGLGFLTMYNQLPYSFVGFAAAPLAYAFLAPEARDRKRLLAFTFLFGAGLTAAFTARFFQVAGYLESFDLALASQLHIAKLRAGSEFEGATATRVMLIGQYSAHVGRFFPLNAIPMGLLGVFFAWLSRGSVAMRRDRAWAMLGAFFACYAWIFLMKNHAIHHTHMHPRTFLGLYLPWILVLAQLAHERRENT